MSSHRITWGVQADFDPRENAYQRVKQQRIPRINRRWCHERTRWTGEREEVRESIGRTDRRDLQRKRVVPSKEERGRCRKENIGNSISGGATIRTPEYISSSHREWEGEGWEEHGGSGGAAMGIITRFICNIPFPVSSSYHRISPFLRGSPRSFLGFASTQISDGEANLQNLLFATRSGDSLCSIFPFFSFYFCLLNLLTQFDQISFTIEIF